MEINVKESEVTKQILKITEKFVDDIVALEPKMYSSDRFIVATIVNEIIDNYTVTSDPTPPVKESSKDG